MKKVILTFALLLIVSFAFAGNEVEKDITVDTIEKTLELDNTKRITNAYRDRCGCVAWADSRDDGSDRTNRRWQKDLDDCRAICDMV